MIGHHVRRITEERRQALLRIEDFCEAQTRRVEAVLNVFEARRRERARAQFHGEEPFSASEGVHMVAVDSLKRSTS